jgi:hypothetical protein
VRRGLLNPPVEWSAQPVEEPVQKR